MTAAAELQAILGCTPADAERALAETKGDLERAMNWLLDAPVTQPRASCLRIATPSARVSLRRQHCPHLHPRQPTRTTS